MLKMGPITWGAAKVLLTIGAPIHLLLAGKWETHTFINCQAIKILDNDGYTSRALLLNNNLSIINKGVMWADKCWKCFAHYFDPYEKSGLKPWPDAASECRYLFKKSVNSWKEGKFNKSLFLLGAAAHLVQDLCVPHHARKIALNGHRFYESWVKEHFNEFSVSKDGLYNIDKDPGGWVLYNSGIAWHYLPYVTIVNSESAYRKATNILLPLAQRTSAGFFNHFIDCISA